MDKEIEVLTQYMELLMNLSKLHKKLYEGRHIAVPTMFSEQICRKLLGLESIKGRNVDAVDGSGNKYEIKGTSGTKGTTTINIHQSAKYLIWIYFDFDIEKIIIKEVDYENAKVVVKKGDDRTRQPITLSQISGWRLKVKINMNLLGKVLQKKKDRKKICIKRF